MSVTIEQRLREMEQVHKMLTAAMADDGVEDDAVKEEYGKTADGTLASLRAKLEEARRREGKDGLGEPNSPDDGDNKESEGHNGAKLQPAIDSGQPQSASQENAQKVCHSCLR